ncbi:MAG: hypothetical protein HC877_17345 [Thioploca sp.]|nr:hypothetical protein [Thioploca sp.]
MYSRIGAIISIITLGMVKRIGLIIYWLATFILLAYLIHTTFDWLDTAYHTVRRLLPSRRTFFEHWHALIPYLPFDSGEHLMKFRLGGLDGKILDST